MTNLEIAKLLRQMAAAYEILGENRFKIIAYDRAADSVEHATSELKDLWDDGKLDTLPGVGSSIAGHLDELFRTGKVKHFESVMKRVPQAVFPLLLVPGLGPKKAYKLVRELKIKDNEDDVIAQLEFAAKTHKIAATPGFGDKSEADILEAIATYKKGQIKENRMELPIADSIAQEVISYLKKLPAAQKIDVLGSLRRQVSTIGDIDIVVATKKPEEIIEHFVKYPHEKLIEKGPTGASLLLHNGRQVDLRVQTPAKYGAMLQYFTGSKNHNIKLRALAQARGLSLNEYGIKDVRSGRMRSFQTEEEFYKALKLPWIPPEIREDKGELEAALLRQPAAQDKQDGLPKLVELKDVKGDLHIHTNYDLSPSHDLGASPLADYLDRAAEFGYVYIGLSDHNPSTTNHSESEIVEIMKKRSEFYKKQLSAWQSRTKKHIQIFVMCEVDIQPDGKLALPEKAFTYVDAVIASIHSSFKQNRELMTKRVLAGLVANPKVRIFGHPTGRLLTKREGYELDWNEIFSVCQKRDIALEINAYPQRLDLPDAVVFDAKKEGLRFCINTDAHAVYQMDMMKYGVSVARRGWCTKNDIVNTMEYNKLKDWLIK